ncbi:hypothetical protein FAIPA1_290004 [Frankia sp. AiPs1]
MYDRDSDHIPRRYIITVIAVTTPAFIAAGILIGYFTR